MTPAEHPLDNQIWHTLNGAHARYSLDLGEVRLYRPEIADAAAMERFTPANFATLAAAVPVGTAVLMITAEPLAPTVEFEVAHTNQLQQMVANPFVPFDSAVAVTELGAADIPAMRRLVDLTKPGPLLPGALQLGRFVGIFAGNELAAMAGDRLRFEGFTEISTVCTHPDFRGRDYAKIVVSAIAERIVASGGTPFLSVLPDNTAAIRLYESLGFVARRRLFVTVLKRL